MSTPDKIQREILPIPTRNMSGNHFRRQGPGYLLSADHAAAPTEGAPNVLIVLIDDAGFGASSAFGGPVHTPPPSAWQRRVEVQPLPHHRLCSPPARRCSPAQPPHGGHGRSPRWPPRPRQLLDPPQVLRPAGRDAQVDGYAPPSLASATRCRRGRQPGGAIRRLADRQRLRVLLRLRLRRDHQYYPSLYEGTTPVELDKTPEEGYHLTEDLANPCHPMGAPAEVADARQACVYVLRPWGDPRPHHVPAEWSAKYKGKFDQGWDRLREETFARQKQLGVIPPDCELTRRHPEIPAWDDISPEMKPILARQMEIYAGFLEHTDYHVGRLIDALADLEILDDTLIYYIIGDNGASGEGTLQGTFNEMIPSTVSCSLKLRSSSKRTSTSSRAAGLHTMQWAGRTPWTRPTSGPSRSPRTGAARATAPLSTGRKASRLKARSAASSAM